MTAALIIAAGASSSPLPFQPEKQVGGITAVERLALIFQLAGIERIVVVCGEDCHNVEKLVARMGVVCLRRELSPVAEMLDSVKTGLRYLQGKCRNVLVTPVDVPLFSVETVELLAGSGEKLAVPSHNKKAGHPLLLSAKLFSMVLDYNGGGGLAGAIKSGGLAPHYVEVLDEGVLLDVQKRSDYVQLVKRHSLQKMRPVLKLSIAREQTFFGPGPYQLLSLIDETESLRTACTQMGISYSKGWKMIEHMENHLGRPVISRKRGGHERGRSDITPEGRQLLEAYSAYSKECGKLVQDLFDKHFAAFMGETEAR